MIMETVWAMFQFAVTLVWSCRYCDVTLSASNDVWRHLYQLSTTFLSTNINYGKLRHGTEKPFLISLPSFHAESVNNRPSTHIKVKVQTYSEWSREFQCLEGDMEGEWWALISGPNFTFSYGLPKEEETGIGGNPSSESLSSLRRWKSACSKIKLVQSK